MSEQSTVSFGLSRGLASRRTSDTSSWTGNCFGCCCDDDMLLLVPSWDDGWKKVTKRKRMNEWNEYESIMDCNNNTWRIGGMPRPRRDFLFKKSCSLKWPEFWAISACFRFRLSHHVLLLCLSGWLSICFDDRSLFVASSPNDGLGFKHSGSAMAMHSVLSNWSSSSAPQPCSWHICCASARIVCSNSSKRNVMIKRTSIKHVNYYTDLRAWLEQNIPRLFGTWVTKVSNLNKDTTIVKHLSSSFLKKLNQDRR